MHVLDPALTTFSIKLYWSFAFYDFLNTLPVTKMPVLSWQCW